MAKNGDPCRVCGAGRLTVEVEQNLVEYRGVSESLDSCYAVCDVCGSEQADAAQARANKRLMVAFKKRQFADNNDAAAAGVEADG
jgi:HTH-type transcriptional regulator/antitoxin MqsA